MINKRISLYLFFIIYIIVGKGNITYERVCLSELPKWSELDDKFKEDFMVVDNSGMIENEGIGMLQVHLVTK